MSIVVGIFLTLYVLTSLGLTTVYSRIGDKIKQEVDSVAVLAIIWTWPLTLCFISVVVAIAVAQTNDDEINKYFE